MSIQRFVYILEELAKTALFPAANLKLNEYNVCSIPLPDGNRVQLELDPRQEQLIIATVLGTVTPGTYRLNLFREALKHNGLPPPRLGILSFSTKTDHLLLYHKKHLRDLTGAAVAEQLTPFLEKASIWREAVNTGSVPVVATTSTLGSLGSLLGLR